MSNEEIKRKIVSSLKECDLDKTCCYLEQILPKTVFRYCAHSNDNIDLILNSQIKLSNPKEFNDPFDSLSQEVQRNVSDQAVYIDFVIEKLIYSTPDDKRKILKDRIIKANLLSTQISYNEKAHFLRAAIDELKMEEKNLNEINPWFNRFYGFSNKYVGDFVSDSSVACFSETNKSTLMWSHYGSFGSGLCVEYNTNQIIDNMREEIFYFVPVVYSDNVYSEYNHRISEETRTFIWNLPQFMYKKSDWSYENEWRLVILENRMNYLEFDFIKTIYFGSNFKPYNKFNKCVNEQEQIEKYIKLLEYCNKKGIKIKRMKPDHGYNYQIYDV